MHSWNLLCPPEVSGPPPENQAGRRRCRQPVENSPARQRKTPLAAGIFAWAPEFSKGSRSFPKPHWNSPTLQRKNYRGPLEFSNAPPENAVRRWNFWETLGFYREPLENSSAHRSVRRTAEKLCERTRLRVSAQPPPILVDADVLTRGEARLFHARTAVV